MQTFPIIKEQGHLLLSIDGRRAIIDTGAPASMSTESFEFLGQRYAPPATLMGVTPRGMGKLAGFQIDMLIGCDILSQHTIRMRWQEGLFDVGDDIAGGMISMPLETFMGLPIFPLKLGGNPAKAFFDTGAHLSYINPGLVKNEGSTGQRNDFHPFGGHFVAPTYKVSTALDNDPLDIEYGILPDNLQMVLGSIMNQSDCTAVIGTQLLETFDCTIAWSQKIISWQRAKKMTE